MNYACENVTSDMTPQIPTTRSPESNNSIHGDKDAKYKLGRAGHEVGPTRVKSWVIEMRHNMRGKGHGLITQYRSSDSTSWRKEKARADCWTEAGQK